MLKDKFYEYLSREEQIEDFLAGIFELKEIAQDLADIAEKEMAELIKDGAECDICLDVCFKNEKLNKQIAELESKLADVEYLDRDKVDKIFWKFHCKSCSGGAEMIAMNVYELDDFIDAICKLGIPRIDEDKITKQYTDKINDIIIKACGVEEDK